MHLRLRFYQLNSGAIYIIYITLRYYILHCIIISDVVALLYEGCCWWCGHGTGKRHWWLSETAFMLVWNCRTKTDVWFGSIHWSYGNGWMSRSRWTNGKDRPRLCFAAWGRLNFQLVTVIIIIITIIIHALPARTVSPMPWPWRIVFIRSSHNQSFYSEDLIYRVSHKNVPNFGAQL